MSKTDLRAVFAAVNSDLHPSIVSESARLALQEVVSRFAWVDGSCYIECRLDRHEQPQVDFLASITRYERERVWQALSDSQPSVRAKAGLADAVRLLRAWQRPGTLLHEAIPVAWLEVDDVQRQRIAGSIDANVCVSLIDSYIDPFAPLCPRSAIDPFELSVEAATVIRGSGLVAAERMQLEACFRQLPAGAQWIHLSVMSMRTPARLKLYGQFPRAGLLKFLNDIAWGGEIENVERWLETYLPTDRTADLLYVDFPVPLHGQLESELGLCFAQQHLRTAHERDPARAELLAQFVSDGLCSQEQAAALAEWSKPSRADRTSVNRWLDLKLVCRGGSLPKAKAYLGFSLRRAPVGLTLTTAQL